VVADAVASVVLIVVLVSSDPVPAVAAFEAIERPLIIANVGGAILVFDSGQVRGFNAVDWGWKK
jgi:hypothetical protein